MWKPSCQHRGLNLERGSEEGDNLGAYKDEKGGGTTPQRKPWEEAKRGVTPSRREDLKERIGRAETEVDRSSYERITTQGLQPSS